MALNSASPRPRPYGGGREVVFILCFCVIGVVLLNDGNVLQRLWADHVAVRWRTSSSTQVAAGRRGATPSSPPVATSSQEVSDAANTQPHELASRRNRRLHNEKQSMKENADGEPRPPCWPVCHPVVLAANMLSVERKENAPSSRVAVGQMVADDGGTLLFSTGVNQIVVDVSTRRTPFSWSMFSHRDHIGLVWVDPVFSRLNASSEAAGVALGSLHPQNARIFAFPAALSRASGYREMHLSMDPACHSFVPLRVAPHGTDNAVALNHLFGSENVAEAIQSVERCRAMRGSRPVPVLRGEQLMELLPTFPRRDVLMLSVEGFVAEAAASFGTRLADFLTVAIECPDLEMGSLWMSTERGLNCATVIACLRGQLSKEHQLVGPDGAPTAEAVCGIAVKNAHPRHRWCVLSRADPLKDWHTELLELFRFGAVALTAPASKTAVCPSTKFPADSLQNDS